MWMTEEEIVHKFTVQKKLAITNRELKTYIKVLSELNGCSKKDITDILVKNNIDIHIKETKRKRRRKPNVSSRFV